MNCTAIRRLALLFPAALLCSALAAQEFSLDEEPRRHLEIQVQGASRAWQVRPYRIADQRGGSLAGAMEGDFALRVERWERTGLPRRYELSSWRNAFRTYIEEEPREGARFHFYAISPARPRLEPPSALHMVDETRRIYSVPLQLVRIKGYPQTWVDIFEGYVSQYEGVERERAVKRWEEAHRERIRNDANTEDGFSPEERNEFARFYQNQFVFIRNRNPKQASIYDELAEFHHERGNLDAELEIYMAALRAGVESPDRERFALAVGRIMVERLRLYDSAADYLAMARTYSEGRYLLARCHIHRGRLDDARRELTELVAMLPGDNLILQSNPESETGRAMLALAEIEWAQQRFADAERAVRRIPQGDQHYSQARVLFAGMLLQRARPPAGEYEGDLQRARAVIQELDLWREAQRYVARPLNDDFPLDPLASRAILIVVQTDRQFTGPRPERPAPPRQDLLAQLRTARALDPLSPEPYLAEGRLYQRLGLFREALDAYLGGLEINPRHALLNYMAAALYQRAGLVNLAKDHLEACLKYQPEFAPALVRLGEIALAEVEIIRESLLARMASGEQVDYGDEIVPPMKEAASFLAAALDVGGDQPDTRLALAGLYLRLAETAPFTVSNPADREEVRHAYLTKSRDLAKSLIDRLKAFADGEKSAPLTERDIAAVPSLAAYNTYAFALYGLGHHTEARMALAEHLELSVDERFFVSPAALLAYQDSSALRYARRWLNRIDENRRQYYEIEHFNTPSTGASFGRWTIPVALKPDESFVSNTSIHDGKLVFGVRQRESGVTSRFEIEKPHATLASFEARFARVGGAAWSRGVHMTKYRSGRGTGALATLMVGIDMGGRVFWETREFRPDNRDQPERRIGFGYIDVALYGGVPLHADDSLRLGIRRRLAVDSSEIEYFALINGYEVRLPLDAGSDIMARVDLTNREMFLACGFFASASSGVAAQAEVLQVRFVHDAGLAERRN